MKREGLRAPSPEATSTAQVSSRQQVADVLASSPRKAPFKIPRNVSSTCVSSLENRAASEDEEERYSGSELPTSHKSHVPTQSCLSAGQRVSFEPMPSRSEQRRAVPAFIDVNRSRVASLDAPSLIGLVVPLLRSFCVKSDRDFPSASVFHGTCVPNISLENYMKRILRYGKISHATVIFAIIYIDRILANPNRERLVVTEWNIHRILLGGIVLAAKFMDDEHFNNHHMSAVGGVTNAELNALEMEMAQRLSFSFHVTPEQYYNYENVLVPLVL